MALQARLPPPLEALACLSWRQNLFPLRGAESYQAEEGVTLEQRIAEAAHRCALARTQAEHAPAWRELVRLIEERERQCS